MANTTPASERSKANEAILRSLPHLLDVKDEEIFVSFEDLPGNAFGEVSERIVSGGTWFILGQIESTAHITRPCFYVRDSQNQQFLLAFYLRRGSKEEGEAYKFKPGMTICLERAFQHYFMDGQRGVRLEDDDWSSVRYLPCSMTKLAEISEGMRVKQEACMTCKKEKPASRCSRCLVPYCSADCQRSNWNEHKTVCKVRQQLQALNEEYIMEILPDEEPDYDDYVLSDSDSDGHHSGRGHLSEGEVDEPPESDEEPET